MTAPDPGTARASRQGPVQYRGSDLDSERGPGLGCFRFQLVLLAVLVVLTPLSVWWGWPPVVSAALLFAVIALLLVAGQTIVFLLRLVAADRRGRRRPLASGTRTVGELEDAEVGEAGTQAAGIGEVPSDPGETAADAAEPDADGERPVPQ
ncbi:MAG: hypothetical protein ACJ761_08915 [Chloroflexota bacterium]